MYSPEFKAEALRTLEECNGSCILAAKKLKVVCSRTIRRWRDEVVRPTRRHYPHLSAAQKREIAREVESGTSAPTITPRIEDSSTRSLSKARRHSVPSASGMPLGAVTAGATIDGQDG